MLAQDFALLQRWLPAWWRGTVSALGFPGPLAWTSVRLAQSLESYARSQQRVTLSRAAEAEERELNFSRWGTG
ncbi:hypothetical protein HK414_16525 [Ramlibacter terrae]|uniref:Uncharacterized protein n=1 Tax=Ramlibacter terrae TaxID=2732511 RepID=A0ABX6P5R5_9BURK|nr:hypothetical protein HK414_16525 [Ramlibacter terrae]